jgi:hypothetical protein
MTLAYIWLVLHSANRHTQGNTLNFGALRLQLLYVIHSVILFELCNTAARGCERRCRAVCTGVAACSGIRLYPAYK